MGGERVVIDVSWDNLMCQGFPRLHFKVKVKEMNEEFCICLIVHKTLLAVLEQVSFS